MKLSELFLSRPGSDRDGTSIEKAIPVGSIGDEYECMKYHYPSFHSHTQSLHKIDGKSYDSHTWRNDDGEERTIFFDISKFYGEHGSSQDQPSKKVELGIIGDYENDEIITTLFKDQAEAIDFLVNRKVVGIASPNGKYVATLTKEETGKCVYVLTNTQAELYVGDYVKPFRCSQENVDRFNAGAGEIAKIMLQLEALPLDDREDFLKGIEEQKCFGELGYDAAGNEPVVDGEDRKRGFEGKFIIKEFEEDGIQILETADGQRAFVTDMKNSAMVPKEIDPSSLSVEMCKKLVEATRELWRRRDLE